MREVASFQASAMRETVHLGMRECLLARYGGGAALVAAGV